MFPQVGIQQRFNIYYYMIHIYRSEVFPQVGIQQRFNIYYYMIYISRREAFIWATAAEAIHNISIGKNNIGRDNLDLE